VLSFATASARSRSWRTLRHRPQPAGLAIYKTVAHAAGHSHRRDAAKPAFGIPTVNGYSGGVRWAGFGHVWETDYIDS